MYRRLHDLVGGVDDVLSGEDVPKFSGQRFDLAARNGHYHHLAKTYGFGYRSDGDLLGFRDYLIVHPGAAGRYAALKEELARQFPHDIEGYMAGKEAFIREIIRQAQVWRAKQSANKAGGSL